MSARDDILTRIRQAIGDVSEPDPVVDVPVDWEYGRPLATDDVLADLVEKIEDYRAAVTRCSAGEVTAAVVAALRASGASSVVVPDGIPDAWTAAVSSEGMTILRDNPPLTHAQLNEADAVLTVCAVAMADSGTVALDHGEGQGRRALTLVPDRHVCVVRADQVVSDVPEGMARLAPAIRAGQPITWLSGGSATSDIELSRVEGVHGPRQLSVVLVDG